MIGSSLGGAPRLLRFDVVDVFTDVPFAGNPLAVVHGAADLPDAALLALAREFSYSETAFPVLVDDGSADYAVRIFTPAVELPFAGHPSLGSAWVLTSSGQVAPGALRQRCAAGVVRLDVEPSVEDGGLPGRVRLVGRPPSVSEPLGPALLLAAVGLDVGDLAGTPPRWAGAGLDFAYLHVRADAVARAVPDLSALRRVGGGGVEVVALATAAGERAVTAHVRVFAGDIGVAEDPATGSAALGLGAFLVAAGLLPGEGGSRCEVSQGEELGRPSRLSVAVDAGGGAAIEVSVAGSVVPVSSGEIRVPGR